MQIVACPLREHLSPPPMKGGGGTGGVFVKLTVLCNAGGRAFFLLPPPAVSSSHSLPPYLPPSLPLSVSLRSGLSPFKIVARCGAGVRVDPVEDWGSWGTFTGDGARTQHEREERLFFPTVHLVSEFLQE